MLDCNEQSGTEVESLLDLVPTLNTQRRRTFLNVYAMLCLEEQRTTQAMVYTEQCLYWPPTPTAHLAMRNRTTPDNIRMARMRAQRFMRRNLGTWVDGFVLAVQQRQRENYG